MTTKSFRMWVHADPILVWGVLLDSVESPQKYIPDVEESSILERLPGGTIKGRKIEEYSIEVFDRFVYEGGAVREIKLRNSVYRETVLVSEKQREIRRGLIDHPACSGRITVKMAPASTQNPMAPVDLQFFLELESKSLRAEETAECEEKMTRNIKEEQRRLKEKAEELEKKA